MHTRFFYFFILMILSCKSFASDTISVDLGKIQVFTTEAGSRPGPLMKVFGSKVAVVDEAHPELARALEDEVAKQGYSIAKPGELKYPYAIEELYAGSADGYTPPKSPETSGYSFPVFQLVGTALMCGALHMCSDPAVAVNLANERLNDVTRNVMRDARPGQTPGQQPNQLLVVSKLCTAGGHMCASSLAVSHEPGVTLDDLRMANAREGFPRSLKLK